jgi:hypothetical protein
MVVQRRREWDRQDGRNVDICILEAWNWK